MAEEAEVLEKEVRIVTLTRPIEAHGERVKTLTVREPTVQDLEEASKDPANLRNPMVMFSLVAARCAGIPASSVRSLGVRDGVKLSGALAEMGFTSTSHYELLGVEKGSETGETS